MLKKLLFLLLIISTSFVLSEEGMHPLSEIRKLDLQKAGFKISVDELYNTNGTSLITTLVNLSGCTGSFVSSNGLILTNHHCSYSAVSAASTVEKNYLQNGFVANSLKEEIQAKGITAKIIESYKDVSDLIISAIKNAKSDQERIKIIREKIKEISEAESDVNNDIEASVSEMLSGKSYILFRYKKINDVRIVFAPPLSIGNFGGEEDNWVWPRHTGDFTFLRAYVAPDGSSKGYSEDNVPYQPAKWLEINHDGVKENDFAFILGYPGRTFRHYPAEFLNYQYKYFLPNTADIYDWLIQQYEDLSANNDTLKLEYAPRIKSLANGMKNYRGKILGISRLDLVDKKFAEEKELMNYITNNNLTEYDGLFIQFKDLFKTKNNIAEAEILIDRLLSTSNIFSALKFAINYQTEIAKDEQYRQYEYQENNLDKSLNSFYSKLNNINFELEKRIFVKFLLDSKNITSDYKLLPVDLLTINLKSQIDIENFVASELLNKSSMFFTIKDSLINLKDNDFASSNEKLVSLVYQINKISANIKEINDKYTGGLSRLLPKLVELKMMVENTTFIPDANSTLRLTYGHIKGYTPADAVYYSPFTTLSGIIEKNKKGGEYQIDPRLVELNKNKNTDQYFSKDLNDIPVDFLYNMDTTGGNSGSPILNAYGKLIGLNFDRAYEATINDYAWSPDYSRSIGVDIRYILFITNHFSGAKYLLDELKK